ncbi:MAG: hypothetical protein ACFFD2_18055, partial [Promethearchaeota archaeon]
EPSTEKLAYKMMMKQNAENLTYPNKMCELHGIVGSRIIVFRKNIKLVPLKIYFNIKSVRRHFLNDEIRPYLDFGSQKRKSGGLFATSSKGTVPGPPPESYRSIGIR